MKTIYALATIFFLSLALICHGQNPTSETNASTPGNTPQTTGSAQKTASVPPKVQSKGDSAKGGQSDTDRQPPRAADKDQPKTIPSVVKCAIYSNNGQVEPSDLGKLSDLCPDFLSTQARNIPNAALGTNLFLWITLANKGKLTGEDNEIGIADLRLFINEIEIDDTKCSWVAGDEGNAIIRVTVERPLASRAAWNQILAQGLTWHKVRVSVGVDKKKPLASHAIIGLYVMQFKWYFWLFLAICILLVIILLTNDRFKEMLRDDGPVKNGAKAAYSLSRVQMAYWFALTITAYALIWGITGDRDTINNDILALIGISAGTFLGAVSIDSSKKSQAQTDLPAAAAKLVQAQNVATLAAAAPAAVPATVALANQAVDIQQEAVYRLGCQATADHQDNFLTDILSDATGVSFHRFQIVAWSMVLGVIFIHYVWTTLSMPTFGNTLLGLIGISGGTYLGFKFPEQKTP